MKFNRYMLVLSTGLLFCIGCQEKVVEWTYHTTIELDSIAPIGLTILDKHIWVSDGDNNRLAHLDEKGKLLFVESGFERPMHLTNDGSVIYVPQYGEDVITKFRGETRENLVLQDSLDAPAGVDYYNGYFAIADFYNHRVLYGNGKNWISIGQEGKGNGEFYYPTDVHLTENKIFVADAYNNRVQVFDIQGQFLLTFGKEEKMNAATGIFVSHEEVFVTDFENNKVHVYSHEGKLTQTIASGLDKPTDVYMDDDLLYIANYKAKNLMTYKLI